MYPAVASIHNLLATTLLAAVFLLPSSAQDADDLDDLPEISEKDEVAVAVEEKADAPAADEKKEPADIPDEDKEEEQKKGEEEKKEKAGIRGLEIGAWEKRERVISLSQKGWRYLDTKDGPAKEWLKPDYDDSKWKKGDAPLGYGDNGDTKIVTELGYGDDASNKYRAAFFRLKFVMEDDPEDSEAWIARTVVDDGAMFYLNGQEVHRLRMPEGEVNANTYSAEKTGGSSGLEGKAIGFKVKPESLRKGENVLCVSVHQADADSSDLVLDIELFKATEKEFAAAKKAAEEKAKKEKEEAAKRIVIGGIQPAGPANILRIFDDRMNSEHTKIKHLIRSLKRTIGISEDQAEELTLCADNALKRLRDDVERRSEQDNFRQNIITNEIYQGKISIRSEQGFVDAFAAILEPEQVDKYTEFVRVRKERQLDAMVNMFLSNLDNGLFMEEKQREKMRGLLKEIALDPTTRRNYYGNNPLNSYYQIQNGFNQMAAQKDTRLKEILNPEQVDMLQKGMRNGSIYTNTFIEVDEVLVPIE